MINGIRYKMNGLIFMLISKRSLYSMHFGYCTMHEIRILHPFAHKYNERFDIDVHEHTVFMFPRILDTA